MHSWIGCCRRLFWSRCFGFLFQGDFLWSDLRPDPQSATPSLCEGATNVGAVSGCAVELALRWRAPLGQPRRVSSRGMGAPTPMLTPQPPRHRRSQQGVGQPNIHSGHRYARPSLRSAWRLRPRDGAERSAAKQWPVWMSLGFPSGCAWGAQGAGWRECRRTHALRELTHRSCLSGAPQARSEFCGAPRDRAPQVAPQRSEGVADSRVALSLVTFFRRRERKLLARRATPGLRPQRRHAIRCAQAPRLSTRNRRMKPSTSAGHLPSRS